MIRDGLLAEEIAAIKARLKDGDIPNTIGIVKTIIENWDRGAYLDDVKCIEEHQKNVRYCKHSKLTEKCWVCSATLESLAEHVFYLERDVEDILNRLKETK